MRGWLFLALLTGCAQRSATPAPESSAALRAVARVGVFAARLESARTGPYGLAASSTSAAAPTLLSVGPLRVYVETLDAHGLAAPSSTGVRVYSDALPDADLVRLSSLDEYEELFVVREPCARFTVRYRVRVEGGALAIRDGRVVAHADAAAIASPVAFAVDAAGRTIDAELESKVDGDQGLLAYSFRLADARFPVVVDPSWTAAATSTTPRTSHELLQIGGRIYSFGGLKYTSPSSWLGLPLVESLDAATPASPWKLDGFLLNGRWNPGVAPLPGGKALIVGGYATGTPSILSAAEIFDPAPTVPTFTSVGYGRALLGAKLVPLASGVVLRIGAVNPPALDPFTAELFDPSSKAFSATGGVSASRSSAGLVRLASGKVLALGGSTVTGYPATTTTALSSVEQYDPATNKWSLAGSLKVARGDSFTATLLTSGKVLLVGGPSALALTTAEIFDPASGTSLYPGLPLVGRQGHAATLLPDGRVLIVGGQNATGNLSTTEFYDPATATFSAGPTMSGPRASPSLAFVPPGLVIVSGGVAGVGAPLGSAETLRFGGPGDACTGPGDCPTGNCVDGVCCSTACAGQCEACNEPGSVGTCVAVSGGPRGSRVACPAADPPTCKDWSCDGSLRSACAQRISVGAMCRPMSCVSGSAMGHWACTTAGACALVGTAPCPFPGVCVDGMCGERTDGGLADGGGMDGGGPAIDGAATADAADELLTPIPAGPCSCRTPGSSRTPAIDGVVACLVMAFAFRRRKQ